MGFQYGALIELESWRSLAPSGTPDSVIDRRTALERKIEHTRQLIYGKHDLFHIPTQIEKIWNVLKSKGCVTLWDTHLKPNNGINCIRLGARIWDLKAIGVEFVEPSPKITLPSGKKVCFYQLKHHSVTKKTYEQYLRAEAEKYGVKGKYDKR